jgi:hypothetical protein
MIYSAQIDHISKSVDRRRARLDRPGWSALIQVLKMLVNPLDENADNSIRCIFEPFSNTTNFY